MSRNVSVVHSSISGRKVKPFEISDVTDSAVNALARIGLVFDEQTVMDQLHCLNKAGAFRTGAAMDSAFIAPATQNSVPTPIQFLQNWLPGFVKVMTSARKIDKIIGIQTVGSWEDEEIIQGIVEPSGVATEYGDHTNIPLSSWNANFERRSVVRGEQGINVGLLEEGRSAAMRLNSAETKRQGAAIQLEIFRNAVGFFGWNNGTNRTFGLLNDPELPAPITTSVAGGWIGTTGKPATFQDITGDIRSWMAALRTQSQDNIDPQKDNLVLGLPTNRMDYLSVTTDFGISVRDWLEQTYPNVRIESAPEFQGTKTTYNSGTGNGATKPGVLGEDSLAYLFIEEIDSSIDGSTDDGATFAQLVQTKFITLGVEKRAKSYVEDYSSATAGTLCKRPWAVVRVLGI